MNHYIHIPFCRSKCRYCHFASFSGIGDALKENYISFLKKEIRDFLDSGSPGSSPGSIYFGGGTPSLLAADEIKGILDEFNTFGTSRNASIGIGNDGANAVEITLEANPESITKEYVNGIRKAGVNRISIGIQTLNGLSLEKIGRSGRDVIIGALDILEEEDFPNVSVDFIIGLPYVGRGETGCDIRNLLDRYGNIKHISVYMLEEGIYPKDWKENSINEDIIGDEYAEVAELLRSRGFSRYELSNFAKTGFECRHNSGYWNHAEYRGYGLSASSFIGNRRFTNPSDFIGYYSGKPDHEEDLDEEDLKTERLMFSFRTIGTGTEHLKSPRKLEEFKHLSLVSEDGGRIAVTDRGVAIADYIFNELFL